MLNDNKSLIIKHEILLQGVVKNKWNLISVELIIVIIRQLLLSIKVLVENYRYRKMLNTYLLLSIFFYFFFIGEITVESKQLGKVLIKIYCYRQLSIENIYCYRFVGFFLFFFFIFFLFFLCKELFLLEKLL